MKPIALAWMLSAGSGITLAGDTGLFEAIRANDEKAVASLVHTTADANSSNAQGVTALMQAALHVSVPEISANVS